MKQRFEDAAKQMKESIAAFPDSSAKRQFLGYIETAKNENLRLLDELFKTTSGTN
ncbi:MAG: hypothetical protein WBZ36_19915 [Candidatus Nitrosopolaris sp.]